MNLSQRELNILKKAKQFAKNRFENNITTQIGGHGFDHAVRVAGLAAHLSLKEKQHPFLPVLAALLHDVGRTSDDPRSLNSLHGTLSRELVSQLFISIKLTREEETLVENAIEDHTHLNDKVRSSFVVKILMDADRLDGLGAISPVRAAITNWKLPIISDEKFTEEGKINSIYGHFGIRVLEWTDMMWTKAGKKLAAPRVKFLRKYNRQLKKEIGFSLDNYNSLKIN